MELFSAPTLPTLQNQTICVTNKTHSGGFPLSMELNQICPLLTITLAAIGFIGSFTFLICVAKIRFKQPETPYLVTLALNDATLCLTALIVNPHFKWTALINAMCIYESAVIFVISFVFGFHIWTVVAVTIDRYQAICNPIWHKTRRPSIFPLLLIIPGALISSAVSISHLYEQNTNEYNFLLRFIYVSIHMTFLTVGPLIILLVLTILMLVALRASMKRNMKSALRLRHKTESDEAEIETRFSHAKRKFSNAVSWSLTPTPIVTRKESPLAKPKRNASPECEIELHPLAKSTKRRSLPSSSKLSTTTSNKTSLLTRKTSSTVKVLLKRRSRVYRPLIAILMVSLLCYSMPPIAAFYKMMQANTKRIPETLLLINSITNLLVIVAASTNPIVYVLFCPSFRRKLFSKFMNPDTLQESQYKSNLV